MNSSENQNELYDDDDDIDLLYEEFDLDIGKDEKSDVSSHYKSYDNKINLSKSRNNDKSDIKVSDGVIDSRSRTILRKLLAKGTINEIEGCLKRGKEACVFRGFSDEGNYAVKIYATTNMTFKSRSEYTRGDFRFKNKVSGSAKVVAQWAEKEHRNLLRMNLTEGAIACPKPILQKNMVLVMTLIEDENGEPAPMLKDIDIENWMDAYIQVVSQYRILFQECRLVHGDLSEYNMLYAKGRVYFIDVGQSVEHMHEKALFFLRRDCNVVNNFFRSRGVQTLSLRQFFEIVVDPKFGKHTDEDYLDKINNVINNTEFPDKIDDEEAFLNMYIPRQLSDVDTFMQDYRKVLSNPKAVNDIHYAVITGMKDQLEQARKLKQEQKRAAKEFKKKQALGVEESENESSLDENSEDNDEKSESSAEKHQNEEKKVGIETAEERKQRKQKVREERAGRRKEKKNNTIKQKMKTVKHYKARDIN